MRHFFTAALIGMGVGAVCASRAGRSLIPRLRERFNHTERSDSETTSGSTTGRLSPWDVDRAEIGEAIV